MMTNYLLYLYSQHPRPRSGFHAEIREITPKLRALPTTSPFQENPTDGINTGNASAAGAIFATTELGLETELARIESSLITSF